MPWEKTEGTQSGGSGPLAGFLMEKQISHHKRSRFLQLLIMDEVAATDFTILLGVHYSLFIPIIHLISFKRFLFGKDKSVLQGVQSE